METMTMTTEIRNLRYDSERAWQTAVDTCYIGCTDEVDEARQAQCQHAADAADEAWGRAIDAMGARRIPEAIAALEDAQRLASEWGDDDPECRALAILRSTTWTLRIDDDGGTLTIDAASLDEARTAWIEWARDGEYGDVEDGLPREFTLRGTVTSPLGEVDDVSVRMTRGPRYSIRIYDGGPGSCDDPWPTHDGTPLDAETLDEAREEALDILSAEAVGLCRADGYEVGQRIYAMIDDADDVESDRVSYELTVDDLGEEEEEEEEEGGADSGEEASR